MGNGKPSTSWLRKAAVCFAFSEPWGMSMVYFVAAKLMREQGGVDVDHFALARSDAYKPGTKTTMSADFLYEAMPISLSFSWAASSPCSAARRYHLIASSLSFGTPRPFSCNRPSVNSP